MRSRQHGEFAERGSDDGEVSVVQRGDVSDAQSLRRSDHRRVGRAEGKVSVAGSEFCDPHPIRSDNWLGQKVSCREISEKTYLGIGAQAGAEEVCDFGNHEAGNHKGSRMRLEQFEARPVVSVVAVDVRVEGAGVDDQCDGCTSLARISSIRSEMSSRPLAPAPAASSRRLPI